MSVGPLLSACYRGFRERYLDHAELTAQLEAWREAFPGLVRVESIGVTREGRDIWLVTLGPEPDRKRPAVWVDGNMHASELCGSSVALALAEDVLGLHLAPESSRIPAPLRETLSDVLFYVVPRISPDGAEAVLTSARWIRSVPRDERKHGGQPRWVARDLDGDGRALLMRKEDPTGEWIAPDPNSSVLVPRDIEDPGPFYKLYPEGVITGFDGQHVPSPHFMSDNSPDLNRNFPWSWAPEREQVGAGEFPGSEPESRAVIEAATARPEIFYWVNYHTFGGVFIRPLGGAPDTQLADFDRAIFAQLERWTTEYTGYPMVSGFEEFTYSESKPLHGDLSDFAYHQRGAIAYVCELWDLFARLELPKPKRFCDYYIRLGREELLKLAAWDREHNEQRIFQAWERFEHPQLGPVELGGFDARIGIWNPPERELADICRRQADAFFRIAALSPRLRLALEVQGVEAGVCQLVATIENLGYLPTHVLDSAKDLPLSAPPVATLTTEGGARCLDSTKRELGHLDGWGRGAGSREFAFHIPRSRGTTSRRVLTFTLTGAGTARLVVESPRLGSVQASIELSP